MAIPLVLGALGLVGLILAVVVALEAVSRHRR
jgi:hypothetical protein